MIVGSLLIVFGAITFGTAMFRKKGGRWLDQEDNWFYGFLGGITIIIVGLVFVLG